MTSYRLVSSGYSVSVCVHRYAIKKKKKNKTRGLASTKVVVVKNSDIMLSLDLYFFFFLIFSPSFVVLYPLPFTLSPQSPPPRKLITLYKIVFTNASRVATYSAAVGVL